MDWDRATRLTRKLRYKQWYQLLADVSVDLRWTFMNYGYLAADEPLEWTPLNEVDEWNRYPAQLYHFLYSKVDLGDCDLLDVGSGRGGGASHAARYFGPRSVTGVDFSDKAVELCNRVHDVENLVFQVGDAEMLPFDDGSFDVVSSVEASHCFAKFERFADSVARVLRPGGHFVFADFRDAGENEGVRDTLTEAGLRLLEEVDITPNVIAALEQERGRLEAFKASDIPAALRPAFETFAAGRGTVLHDGFESGTAQYFAMHFDRPA